MNDINKLKQDVASFELFKKEFEHIQIPKFLDEDSKAIVHKDLIIDTGFKVIPVALGTPYDKELEVSLNGVLYRISSSPIWIAS